MKNKSVIHVLSVLLLVMLMCGIIPAAYADNAEAAAPTREQMLLDYISCVMAADKAQSRDEQEAILSSAEELWNAYTGMLRGQWKEEVPAPAPAETAVVAAEDPEALGQELLTYYMMYVDAANREKDPAVKAKIAAEADKLLDMYLDVLDTRVTAEEIAPMAEEKDAQALREELLSYYLLYLNAAKNEPDLYARENLYATAEELWNTYMNLVLYMQECPSVEQALADEDSTDALTLRRLMIYYYMQYLDAAERAKDPRVKAQLAAEAEELWNTYLDLVLYSIDPILVMPAEEAEKDIYLGDWCGDNYLTDPAAGEMPEAAEQTAPIRPDEQAFWNDFNNDFVESYVDMLIDEVEKNAEFGMPNPWTTTDSLEEAETLSGVALNPPVSIPRGMELQCYRAADGTIEADYSNGTDLMILRASLVDEGYYLSGDYNSYSIEWAENVKGLLVNCLGDGKNANVATFVRGGVAFALTTNIGREGTGLTESELEKIVLETMAEPVVNELPAEVIGGVNEPQDIYLTETQETETAEVNDNGDFEIEYTYTYTDENGTVEKTGTLVVPADSTATWSDLQAMINEQINAELEKTEAPAAEPVAPAAEPEAPTAEPAAPAAEPEAPAAEPAEPAAEPEAAEEPNDSALVTNTDYALVISDPYATDAGGKPVRLVRIGETNLGDLCADAYRVQSGADIGIVDAGAICADIKPGEITINDILSIYPYGDELCVIEATGEQILNALEWGSRAVPNEFGGFLQVSGLSYEVHDYIESGCIVDENGLFAGGAGERRVKNVMIGNEPLDPEKTYTVAGPNFVLLENGAGNTAFQGARLIKEHIKPDTQVLVDYIIDNLHGVIGPEYSDPYGQGRIVIFEVAPAAK